MFTTYDFLQIIIFLGLLIGLTPVLGSYMYKVFTGEKHLMSAPFGWLERLTYKLVGVDATEETNWKTYAFGMLLFNLIGFLFLFFLLFFWLDKALSKTLILIKRLIRYKEQHK